MRSNSIHLSLYLLIPLILVLFSLGPLWVALTVWNAGSALPPDGLHRAHRWIEWLFWISGAGALLSGLLIAYAITRPIARLSHAVQDIASGLAPSRLKVESSEEFAPLGDAFNRMVSTLQGREKIRQAERLAALGTLAAGVAHEIRNPLGSIRGLAQLLAEGESDPQFKTYARTIVGQTDRLNGALETLLHLARPSNPSRTKEDLNGILRKAAELIGIERSQKEIDLVEEYDGGLPPLEVDREALLQGFFNILLNAVQAVDRGGRIRITSRRDPSGGIRIAIANTGPVIPPDRLERIFDPFFTTKEAGTGLGLAITHQVIDSHGGSVRVRSGGDETEFTIEFPARAED